MLSNFFLHIKDKYLKITAEYNLKTNIFPQGEKIRDLKGVRKKREREMKSSYLFFNQLLDNGSWFQPK